jgi:taurine dioxygenase
VRTVTTSPAVGVEVRDLDLRDPIRPPVAQELRQAFSDHHLLVFRDQQLTGPQQVAAVGLFGPTLNRGRYEDGWAFVSNVRPDGLVPEGGLAFHFDLAFTDEPFWGLSLYGLEVPADGAPTWFANSARAAATLTDDVRTRIRGKKALNVFDFNLPQDRRLREADIGPGMPRAEHPVVAPHPRLGVPVLLVCEQQTDRIIGVPPEESEELLAELFAALYSPDNVYVHAWRTGDLLIWDNLAVQHGRPAFAAGCTRTLRRVTIAVRSAEDLYGSENR